MKNKYKIITITVSIIICISVIALNFISHKNTQKIYLQQTEKIIIELKKDFLKDTVSNVISEIDNLRETKYSNYKKNIDSRQRRLEEELDLSDKDFISFFKGKFTEDPNIKLWTAFLWNSKTGEVLFSSDLNTVSVDITVKNLKLVLSSYSEIEKGDIKGIFGVKRSYIDDIVKKEIGDAIKNREFSNGSYIWVNEVINYDGGKNYAIRRIHPNLKNTEQEYLSTDTKDIKGNFPYLEELEGVKKNGELFFTYYFKKMNEDKISEKITYSKLYKDYNWIIAMGVHLDDIDAYTKKINKEIASLSSKSIMGLLRDIFLVLLGGFIILYYIDKKHLSTSTGFLEKEINLDKLTNSYSRRYGERNLDTYYNQFKMNSEKPAVMMFDIDGFKYINDKYGHKSGDIVLVEIVKVINNMIRSSDQLIRWGGDEFVGIFPGLKQENLLDFGEKLLSEISKLEIPVGNECVGVTISIGFSYFRETDNDSNDVLKRADDAMYKSKKEGKNRVNIFL